MRASAILALMTIAAFTMSCEERPLTQIIVVVDSNLLVPQDIDRLHILVNLPGDPARRVINGTLSTSDPFPRTVALVHEGGSLGPIELRVEGRDGVTPQIAQDLSFSFRPEESLMLQVNLMSSCLGFPCPLPDTCRDGECQPVELPEDYLTPWSSVPAPMGARNPSDADASLPASGL